MPLKHFVPVAASVGAWLVASGCSRGPERVPPPAIEVEHCVQRALAQYDTDGDGMIGPAELERSPALRAARATIDADGDGAVSGPEIAARIKAWQQSKVARQSLLCRVYCQDVPVAGATVRLVPEAFLGAGFPAARGVTDESGTAMIDAEGELPGVACGLYRVEISKIVDGEEMILPSYNSQTTLGLEVTQNSPSVEGGIRFDVETGANLPNTQQDPGSSPEPDSAAPPDGKTPKTDTEPGI